MYFKEFESLTESWPFFGIGLWNWKVETKYYLMPSDQTVIVYLNFT